MSCCRRARQSQARAGEPEIDERLTHVLCRGVLVDVCAVDAQRPDDEAVPAGGDPPRGEDRVQRVADQRVLRLSPAFFHAPGGGAGP